MDADAKKTTLRMIPYGLYVLTAADKDGTRNEAVPDVEFGHLNKLRDRGDIAIIEAMSSVQFQPSGDDSLGRGTQGLELEQPRLPFGAIRVSPGVQLDRVCLQFGRCADLSNIRVKKQADRDSGLTQPANGLSNGTALGENIESPLGRHFLAPLGDQCRLVWPCLAGNLQD